MNGCFTNRTNARNAYYLAITIVVVARNVRKRGKIVMENLLKLMLYMVAVIVAAVIVVWMEGR